MCLTVFCINSINIYAGVNGLEVGQSIIVAIFCIIYSAVCLDRAQYDNSIDRDAAIISLLCSLIFATVSLALYSLNKFPCFFLPPSHPPSSRYPAEVFVGDTFTHWAGGVLASIGSLGHYPLVFIIPFLVSLYSVKPDSLPLLHPSVY